MVILQVVTFTVTRLLYPPEPKIIYRDGPIQYISQPQPPQLPVLSETKQETQLPEYEPRKPASSSLRLDPELPPGLQETRPDGT